MLRIRGNAHQITISLVGTITYDPAQGGHNRFLVVDAARVDPAHAAGFGAVLTSALQVPAELQTPCVYNLLALADLDEGDVVSLDPNGQIVRQYRVQSRQNFLLATERCNSNCLMCSQPPKDRDDTGYLMQLYRQVIPLIPADCAELGITGGEPTLLGDAFFELLGLCKQHLPTTELHCLTNGRTFAWKGFAERLGALELPQLMLGIPLYADHYHLHDYIVQAPGAFDQTVRGLHHLAAVGQRVEIRVVVHRLTVPRLVKLAKFIYRNLPFVEHVTFMGLENTGYTPHNRDKLWMDPVEYMTQLQEAVEFLALHRLHVSIYNHQLCLLPESLWGFARRSISDWKNIYLPACDGCGVQEQCGGFFASCASLHSAHIRAISPEQLFVMTNE
ncbi:His-Xaa-Ser system radical SAM maturase HxsC [Hymenobacter sp. GOD-10R]|uniref:His-Xaa-Ser system radical SAM maturase HxsC n=1 Tax=Hymenobacter sp. GOD-10R TaxID=3093922 RepID=UPI002D76929F|nr:His-Xaa-Ser system radical SAM maturase HxsC [Hymenobacter sp. GOD-10R]WRQ31825.1 His-Xaa-Ser system radical SAM maturase HxsC [Hymenobacter sp. GOD-10R]